MDFLIFRVLGGAGAGVVVGWVVGAKPGAVLIRSGEAWLYNFSKRKIGNMLHILV